MRVVAGVGLRRGRAAGEIVALVLRAEREVGRRVEGLAAPEFKRGEAALAEAARALGVGLVFVAEAELRAVQGACVTRSDLAVAAVGVGSVAEGCALAAAGEGARLLLARIDGDGVTCAVAEGM